MDASLVTLLAILVVAVSQTSENGQSLLCNHKRTPLGNTNADSPRCAKIVQSLRSCTSPWWTRGTLAAGLTFQRRYRECRGFVDLTAREKLSFRPQALFPGAFNCCTKISDEIPKGTLRRVEWFEMQKADGLCHLEAVILYIEGKKFCVSPWIRKFKKWMKKNKHKIHRRKPHIRKQRRTKIIKKKEKKQ